MGNFHYIITGLPNILPDSDGKAFSYKELRDSVYDLCSEEDQGLIDFLELGFDEEKLNEGLYQEAASSKNRFIRDYFAFDNGLRNLKVINLSEKLTLDPDKYLIDTTDVYFEEKEKALTILNGKNIIEKERLLDRLVWDKVNEITALDYFNIEKLLAFLIKAKITDRWCKMDKEKGAGFFKQLVNEVRGTFKGVGEF